MPSKICKICDVNQSIANFSKNNRRKDKLCIYCKKCTALFVKGEVLTKLSQKKMEDEELALKSYTKKRKCRLRSCSTILNSYHAGPYCLAHGKYEEE